MRYDHEMEERLFPRAAFYRRLQECGAAHEEAARYFPYSERHLQAVWFDGRLRPSGLTTVRGEPVTVENPGRWNLEAGPDFLDAVLRIGREQRRLAGDAEIHVVPADWKHHGHHADPRYAGVRFHICWFPGETDEALFPPGTVHLVLCDACTADLESIDLTAYPYHEPRTAAFPLAGCDPSAVTGLLEAAGEERLRRKAGHLMRRIRQRGERQALYEETAAALGYKHNKAPFRRLAQRLPVDRLRAEYGSDASAVQAVMLGAAGLLPSQPPAHWPEETKKALRTCWDIWWREQHKWEETGTPDGPAWRLSGVRPLNHPVRRLAALAQWTAVDVFGRFAQVSWRELTCVQNGVPVVTAGRHGQNAAVGPGRAQAILLNVIIPYRLGGGDAAAFNNLPVEPMNSVIRETAHALFGPDHSPKLYRSAPARQGLIQIFQDFVVSGRLDELKPAADGWRAGM